MKINRIDHISIAVKSLMDARANWEPILGKTKPDDVYTDENEKINVAQYLIGDVSFELMESTSPDGEVAKFIQRRGEGIMLISFNVNNTRDSMKELTDAGYPFVGDTKPFRNGDYVFVHPRATNGVLLELIDSQPT